MPAPTLSVIIPAAGLDGDPYAPDPGGVRRTSGVLFQQLESLAAQDTTEPWELILADNGLAPATRNGLNTWLPTYQPELWTRTRILDCTQKQSKGYAVNRAAEHAAANLLVLLDADDVTAPSHLRHMHKALEQAPFVAGRLDHIKLNPPWIADRRPPMQHDGLAQWMGWDIAIGANTGIHKWAWNTIHGMDENLHTQVDVDLSLRLGMRGIPPAYAPDPVVHYRYRDGLASIWRQETAYGRGETRLYAKHRHHLKPRPLRRTARDWANTIGALGDIASPDGRARLATRAGHTYGRLTGSIANGVVYL